MGEAQGLVSVAGSGKSAGAEVAVFCDRCGYALNGLPMLRCSCCDVLQFTCPECGHHQAINSQALAMLRISRWIRVSWLVASVLIKLNFFGWTLFGWFVFGNEVSRPWYGTRSEVLGMDQDTFIGLAFFGGLFGAVGRMLLLRWRSGLFVALSLGAAVVAAECLGAGFRLLDRGQTQWGGSLPIVAWWSGTCAALGAIVVWFVWVPLVKTFLPRKASGVLLEWQRGLSAKERATEEIRNSKPE